MKLVAISDTHMFHRDIKIPEGDILIHAGDATSMGTLREVSEFARWLGSQPHDFKFFIPGNHDFLFEQNPDLANQMIEQHENCFCLVDDEIVIDGVKFFGSPWTPMFGDWAFMEEREGEELYNTWEAIPEDTDVLITHGPPKGILDVTVRMLSGFQPGMGSRESVSVGCEHLKRKVETLMPRIHIFGHIHEGYGIAKLTKQDKITSFYNACICNEWYDPTRQAVEIEVK